jgi:hypothetical protein
LASVQFAFTAFADMPQATVRNASASGSSDARTPEGSQPVGNFCGKKFFLNFWKMINQPAKACKARSRAVCKALAQRALAA